MAVFINFQGIADATGRKLETVFHEFTQDVASEVVFRTPVVTGFLRGSWFSAINSDNGAPGTVDKQGSFTLSVIGIVVNSARPGDTVLIGNNANYARHVEFGTKHFTGRAMVASTLREVNNIMRRTIGRIRRFG